MENPMRFNKQHFLIFFIFFYANITISQTITSISPKQNETNVPPNSNIVFGFDVQPDPLYVNSESIFIYGSQTGRKKGNLEIFESGYSVKFTPNTQFKAGEIITAIISQKLKFINGQLLPKPLIWQFYIGALHGDSNFFKGQTFEIIQNQRESRESSDVCGIDIDGNNSIEILIPYMNSNEYGIFELSDGQYYQRTSLSLGSDFPASVMAADLNMDYKIDLLVFASGPTQSWINSGDFTFMHISSIEDITTSSILNDFNGDGDFDIATLDTYENKLKILMNNGHGIFNYYSEIQVGSWPLSITSGDFDNDFDMDIAVSDGATSLNILTNNGMGNFSNSQVLNAEGHNLSIRSCDFNNDGYPDIAAANKFNRTVTIFINDKKGSFIKYDKIDTGYSLHYLNYSDFNADGNIDIVAAGSLGSYILLNNGDGSFELGQNLIRGDFIIVGDYDMDGDIDIGLSSKYNDELQLYKNNSYPEVFNLVSPSDSERLNNLGDFIHFSWNKSNDPDNDSLKYCLQIYNSSTNITIENISNNFYDLFWWEFIKPEEKYHWSVSVSDNYSIIVSADTFSFRIILPKEFITYQNYPNPFNRSTHISYLTPSAGHVIVSIFDLQGKLLTTIVDKFEQPGYHQVVFYADRYASGLYLCYVKFKNITKVRKMLLVK